MVFLEFFSVFVFGGIGYGSLELVWRGYTHWTMILTGGVCCALMQLIATRMREALWKKWVMCAAVITTVEFVVGCVVNLKLGWQVWDYSSVRGNLLGQICPQFSLCWLALSVPGVAVAKALKKHVFVASSKTDS